MGRLGVAVIIPTRDRAALLWETLRSVREQTYPPSEVIVVDDGSRDRTAEVAAEFGAQLLRNERGGWGPARARNAGAARAQATHLLFLDSDDLLVPDALERLSAALVGAPQAPFAFGRGLAARREAAGWRSEGVIRPADWEPATYRRRLYVTNVVPSGGALVVGERFHAVGGYDPRVVHSEDHHLWLRLSRLGMPDYVPRVVIVRRRRPAEKAVALDERGLRTEPSSGQRGRAARVPAADDQDVERHGALFGMHCGPSSKLVEYVYQDRTLLRRNLRRARQGL